ncbi:hypothetical protein GUITHDRAFT_121678 [Guillardia theta CCMP2712]|uniref:N-acetyltransferase domain-containing protein n=1 Tax=Guillardia theta (strain CCMP2712) TaxID=905079 RepID=L1I8G7_GUITC|nr:hypothetical protein GUITHDRAFT_121678 [Guillardia theta CCMP2712]EKX32145.1 hypothetical protein GUITHDRAFT_121678 [Guillardia theta CCMP2712]|eukprot:XP_005819125.1 hypothetical protein GUITHDRAFT_121678 [Guillardia theta CCMP2712]
MAALRIAIAAMLVQQSLQGYSDLTFIPATSRVISLHHRCMMDRRKSEWVPVLAPHPTSIRVLGLSMQTQRPDSVSILDATPKASDAACDIIPIVNASMKSFYGCCDLSEIPPELAAMSFLPRSLVPFLPKSLLPFRGPDGKEFFGHDFVNSRKQVYTRLSEVTRKDPKTKKQELCAVGKAVINNSGEIAGAVELILVPYPARPSPPKPYLFNLSVLPRYRRQGIARKLVEWCEDKCKTWGYSEIFLHVENDNVRQIYSNFGYRETWQQPTWLQLNVLNKVRYKKFS